MYLNNWFKFISIDLSIWNQIKFNSDKYVRSDSLDALQREYGPKLINEAYGSVE